MHELKKKKKKKWIWVELHGEGIAKWNHTFTSTTGVTFTAIELWLTAALYMIYVYQHSLTIFLRKPFAVILHFGIPNVQIYKYPFDQYVKEIDVAAKWNHTHRAQGRQPNSLSA